ncbi:hypothetical protein FPHYL_1461 [Fusarium phyllophilum]|uniref:LysM domain-containing protein n=1 Tax=Fusarium phyllophilum TaxID=47803 RepID=A0A8H5KDR6_9HYPO|nr:hypothetical protein FPHYL_1461 [Fusarium phyllophilum]
MRICLGRSHGLLASFAIAARLADAAGIAMFPQGYLADRGISSACEATLYQSVNCPQEASYLMSDGYIDSDDQSVVELVCRQVCGSSIGHMRTKVASACGSAELTPGMPYVSLVDKFWSSWNQSCFTDPKTGNNCQAVIAAFPDVESLSELPKSDLCSYCNVEQYVMMQADAFTGAYDEYAKASYEYVAKACNLDVDNFNATDSAFNITVPDTTSNICVSGNTYITKDGDSCDSIALAQGVSAATMYYINSNIFDCHKIATGTELCLPFTCTKIYKVKQSDTCLDIAMNANILQDKLLSFNSQLNWSCTNLHDADPYWGSTLCVSTPGGTYSGQPLNSTEPFDPQPIDPPKGATVANGTTKECSHWIAHDGSLSCTQICLAYDIPINLFTAVNPSLSKSTCDTDLVVGNAYCLKPVNGWDLSDGTETASPTATATKSATSTNSVTSTNTAAHTSTGEKVPSPTQPGIVDGCNKWHYVDNGDGCYSIAEKYQVKLADFYSWNSEVGNDCSGLWLHYYVCVGVAS